MAPMLSVSVRVGIAMCPSPITRRESGRQWPAQPLADGAPHDPVLVGGREPRELLGEQRDGLPPRAGQPRPVRPPEDAPRPERVDDLAKMLVQPAVRVRLRG